MTETLLIDTLDCQNVVVLIAIEHELALKPRADDLDGADYAIKPAPTLMYYPSETGPTS